MGSLATGSQARLALHDAKGSSAGYLSLCIHTTASQQPSAAEDKGGVQASRSGDDRRCGGSSSARTTATVPAAVRSEVQTPGQKPATAQAQAQSQTVAQAQVQALVQSHPRAQAQAWAETQAQAEALARLQAQVEAHGRALAEAQSEGQAQAQALALAEARLRAEMEAKLHVEAQLHAFAKAQTEAQPHEPPPPPPDIFGPGTAGRLELPADCTPSVGYSAPYPVPYPVPYTDPSPYPAAPSVRSHTDASTSTETWNSAGADTDTGHSVSTGTASVVMDRRAGDSTRQDMGQEAAGAVYAGRSPRAAVLSAAHVHTFAVCIACFADAGSGLEGRTLHAALEVSGGAEQRTTTRRHCDGCTVWDEALVVALAPDGILAVRVRDTAAPGAGLVGFATLDTPAVAAAARSSAPFWRSLISASGRAAGELLLRVTDSESPLAAALGTYERRVAYTDGGPLAAWPVSRAARARSASPTGAVRAASPTRLSAKRDKKSRGAHKSGTKGKTKRAAAPTSAPSSPTLFAASGPYWAPTGGARSDWSAAELQAAYAMADRASVPGGRHAPPPRVAAVWDGTYVHPGAGERWPAYRSQSSVPHVGRTVHGDAAAGAPGSTAPPAADHRKRDGDLRDGDRDVDRNRAASWDCDQDWEGDRDRDRDGNKLRGGGRPRDRESDGAQGRNSSSDGDGAGAHSAERVLLSLCKVVATGRAPFAGGFSAALHLRGTTVCTGEGSAEGGLVTWSDKFQLLVRPDDFLRLTVLHGSAPATDPAFSPDEPLLTSRVLGTCRIHGQTVLTHRGEAFWMDLVDGQGSVVAEVQLGLDCMGPPSGDSAQT